MAFFVKLARCRFGFALCAALLAAAAAAVNKNHTDQKV